MTHSPAPRLHSEGATREAGEASPRAHDHWAAQLLELRAVLDEMARKNAVSAELGRLPAADLEHWLLGTRELERQCEAFRKCFYPRCHKVFVALGAVSTIGKIELSVEIVFDGSTPREEVGQ